MDEEPGGLQSMGSLRVGYDWVSSLSLFPFMHWRRKWQPTSVFLLGESQGWWSLVGCSPWGREELDMTERLYFHFSLSCIGEGSGNPLQCSCLENPRDRGASWEHPSMGSHRVGHDWSNLAAAAASFHVLILEKEMATHSSILAWKTIWREEPGRLQSIGW